MKVLLPRTCCLEGLTLSFHNPQTKQLKVFVRCTTTNSTKPRRRVQLFKSRLVLFRKAAVPSQHCRWAWPVAGAVSTNGRTPSVASAGCWTTLFAPGSPPSTSRSDPLDQSWCQKASDAAQKWRRRYCCWYCNSASLSWAAPDAGTAPRTTKHTQ